MAIAALAVLFAVPAQAAEPLLITGYATMPGRAGTANLFDPHNMVYNGNFGNRNGIVVPVSNNVTEFGWFDNHSTVIADFQGNELFLEARNYTGDRVTYVFNSSISGFFAGARLIDDSFGGTLSVAGDTLTFFGPRLMSNPMYATIRFANSAPGYASAVPEPATWTIFIGGFGLIGGGFRLRSRKLATV